MPAAPFAPPVGPDEPLQLGELAVPKSFELYIEGAKWILAIIAALLAFGFDFLRDHPGYGPALIAYALTASILCISAAAAVIYLWKSHSYLVRREGGETREEAAPTKRASDYAFVGMLCTFAAGLICFAIFGACLLFELRQAQAATTSMVAMGDAVLVQRGEHYWLLEHRQGEHLWSPIPPPVDGPITEANKARLPALEPERAGRTQAEPRTDHVNPTN